MLAKEIEAFRPASRLRVVGAPTVAVLARAAAAAAARRAAAEGGGGGGGSARVESDDAAAAPARDDDDDDGDDGDDGDGAGDDDAASLDPRDARNNCAAAADDGAGLTLFVKLPRGNTVSLAGIHATMTADDLLGLLHALEADDAPPGAARGAADNVMLLSLIHI